MDVEEWDAEFFGPDSMWLRQWPPFACIRARDDLPGRDSEETWLGRNSADEEADRFAWQGSEVACGTCDRGSRVGDQASQQADGEVAQAGEHLGAVALAHLAAVFVEGGIPYPMQAVLDAPVAAIEFQQPAGRGAGRAEIGDAVGEFSTLFAGFRKEGVALDQAGLAYVGEIQEIIERGRRAQGAFLDAPVGLIERAVLRGEWPSSRRL